MTQPSSKSNGATATLQERLAAVGLVPGKSDPLVTALETARAVESATLYVSKLSDTTQGR